MNNVVKLTAKKKPDDLEIDKWHEQIEAHGDKLIDRLYDAIRLSGMEAEDEGVPEEFVDCSTLGVLSCALVHFAHSRNVATPSGLLKLVRIMIKRQDQEA